MQIDIPLVLAVLSAVFAGIAWFRNTKSDTKQDAGQLTTVIVKLENISDDVREVKADMKDVKSDMDKMKERITLNEASTKSAHKRIDYLQGMIVEHGTKQKEESKET